MDKQRGAFTYGVPVREPYPGESAFFKAHPDVGGMAADDYSAITMNPHSNLSEDEKNAVATNESARVHMRQYPNMQPDFALTPEQQFLRRGYGPDLEQRETTAARLMTGDPSAGQATPQQGAFVKRLRAVMGAVGPQGPEPLAPLGRR
jgi:hypothetical protein